MVPRHATAMGEGMMIAILIALSSAVHSNGSVCRTPPKTGVRHYLYQAIETVVGRESHGYRTQFDLQVSDGAIYAVIHKSSVLDGSWKAVEPDPNCRAAMHGDSTSLARVKLSPLDPEVAKTLGSSFLAQCAPPGIFFPLTDILNVAIIPTSNRFRAAELRSVGDTLSYRGFDAAFDRSGTAMKESSPGGQIKLAMVDKHRAVLDWQPATAQLELIENSNKVPVHLKGTETFAFRVEVDRSSGLIEHARTTYDNLSLKVLGAPDSFPPVRITRTVTIDRL
jgi:hypothetical protein